MAYDEKLVESIRERLAELPDVYEKEMMGGLVFMYNGRTHFFYILRLVKYYLIPLGSYE